MDRSTVYSTEQGRGYDFLYAERLAMEALSQQMQDILGGTNSMFTGLLATQTSPASLTINIGQGVVYQESTIDPTPWGALLATTSTAFLQGIVAASQLTISTGALGVGQSQWVLVEAQFTFSDVIPSDDPTGGVLPFFNASNPTMPFQGPGNSGQSLSSRRLATVNFKLVYGTPATTGSEAPPNPDSGWVPLYLIDIANGQTQITTSEILLAGPSVGTGVPNNYPQAPQLAGLLNQHHKGIAGQAPKIDLTVEVQNVLPLGNLPASNNIGLLPTIRLAAGTPSGSVAGNADDLYFDTSGGNLYVCTATGSTSTAVWVKAVTTAGSSPTGAAGGDLGGSYPNPSVVAISGMPVLSGQTLAAGQMLVSNSTPKIVSVAPTGDLALSAVTAGLATVVGVRGIPVVSAAPGNGAALTYVSASNNLQWIVPAATVQSEIDQVITANITLSNSFQVIQSKSYTMPAGSGFYRLILIFNIELQINSGGQPGTNGTQSIFTDSLSNSFGVVSDEIITTGTTVTGGLHGTIFSPRYAAGANITIYLQAKLQNPSGGVTTTGANSYMNAMLIQST